MIFKLIIIIAVKKSERKLKNILQVVKLNKPPATKKNNGALTLDQEKLPHQSACSYSGAPPARVARAQPSTMGKKIW